MEYPSDKIVEPEGAYGERTPAELVNLIKKLRWIGMEEEALRIKFCCSADAAATLLSGPYDTD